MAEECFTGNDVVLANRPKFIVSKYVGYNATHLIAASYGDHWRNLRRIAAVELFSTQRLNAFLYIRKDEIQRLISRLSRDSLHGFVEVEMKSLLANLASNNIIRMAAGKRYYGEENDEAKFVRQLVAEVVTSAGAGNPADYLSIVRWFTNYEKRIKNLGNRFDAFLQRIVDEKRADKEKGETMIDRLLSLQETQPDYYTDDLIKGLHTRKYLSISSYYINTIKFINNQYAQTLTIGGTDTSAVTLEWALSNLLNHPEVLKKARAEIDDKIGFDRLVDEPDIVNLPYLQNIVSETLRLYPAVPLLLPHVSSDDCKVAGYDVPRGTMVLTNVWAMHRDPKLWEDPELFKPERFEKEGEAEKLLPFGMGRRACPGAGLAQRLVSLVLATLVQCFEWERVGEELVDMTEDKGVTLPKLVPLRTMCKSRPIGVELKALSMPANLLIHSKVTIAIGSNSQSTSPPLAGIISAPAESTIMEEISSPIMVSKTNLEIGDNSLAFTPTHDSLSHNHTEQPNVQDDEDGLMSDAMANLNTSRGVRPIKPLQKYQDMNWNTIRGKGKRGRRGRGYHTP
ncbi:hypothetical protein Bca4012_086350 [Brassica carinata]